MRSGFPGPVRVAFLLPLLAAAAAPAGVVRATVDSAAAGGPVRIVVLTPPSFESQPGRRYPVVYFLHDALGSEEVLVSQGVAARLEEAMRAGTLPELLIVAPRGKGTWWANAHHGKVQMADFLDRELLPWAEGRFRAAATRDGRGVVGISMGGFGAIRWALASPDRFAVAAGLSPAVQQLSWRYVQRLPFFARRSLLSVFGSSETDNSMRANDVYEKLLDDPALGARAPAVILRTGTEDQYRLDQIIPILDRFLRAYGVTSTATLEPGKHDWTYWRASFPRVVTDMAAKLRVAEDPR